MSTGRPFAARIFESPAIKSWKDAEAPALRRAMASAFDTLRAGGPLVLDLLVEFEAENLERRIEASPAVLLWRSRPSTSLGAKLRRTLGFYSGESILAAAVQLASAAELEPLLPGTMLWDAEVTIYPPPSRPLAELSDPHYEIPGFASAVPWTVSQDAGSENWLLTAVEPRVLEQLCEVLARAFEAQGLTSAFSDAPPEVYGVSDA